MDTNLTLSQKELQKLSTNQIQSLNILALSTESLYNLLQKESEENPFMEYSPNQRSSAHNDTSFLDFCSSSGRAQRQTIYFGTSKFREFYKTPVGPVFVFGRLCR